MPPSKIGIGSKFIIKSETEIKDINSRILIIPILKFSEKPSSIVEPNISVILAGPETAFLISTPLNKTPRLFIVTTTFSKAPFIPCQNA